MIVGIKGRYLSRRNAKGERVRKAMRLR